MGRATTKTELLAAAEHEYGRLTTLLGRFPAEALADIGWCAQIEDQSRHPRDVLTHVHAWQQMVLDWSRTGAAGGTPQVPAPGLTWRETPVVNRRIWERFATTSYAQARDLLDASHQDCLRAIEGYSQEQLFERGVYAWTRTSTLGSYFVSATSSHYVWAAGTLKRIEKWRNTVSEGRGSSVP